MITKPVVNNQKRLCLLGMLLVFLLSLCRLPAAAQEEGDTTLRVAFPIQKGLTELDGQGRHTGYTYEFLEEIAQYTGWDYEFVELEGGENETLSEMLDMLQRGELDLMGGMTYNEQLGEIYDYAGYSYGTAYTTLKVLSTNAAVNETNFQSLKNMRIAVYKSAETRIASLLRFCETNGITPQLLYCTEEDELKEKIRSGQADAFLDVDLNNEPEFRVIAKFSPIPFYLATTKGNTEIVSKINSAILNINESDPYFASSLYQKYFGIKSSGLMLSDEEAGFISSRQKLRVGIDIGRAPIQYVGSDGELRGLSKDILTYVSEKTGLAFEYVLVQNAEQLASLIEQGEIDIAPGIVYNYDTARKLNVALTRPFSSSQLIMVVNNRVDPGALHSKRLALAQDMQVHGLSAQDVFWYPTLEDCIKAVNSGKADYTYGGGFSVQYYAKQYYKNITLLPQPEYLQKLCIGISKPADERLLTILNKAILSIPENELQSMIYRNTTDFEKEITLSAFINDNPLRAITIVLFFALAVLAIMAVYLYNHMRFSHRIALDNERYMQLSELSGEYLFEFNFERDRLSLSEKCAEIFDCSKILENCCKSFPPNGAGDGGHSLFHRLCACRSGTEDIHCRMPDGSHHWYRVISKVICNPEQRPIYSIGKITDIQKEMDEQLYLRDKAQKDSLTDVYNAATAKQLIRSCLENEKDGRGALIILDVDKFKDINDIYGHFMGDQVLIGISQILKETFSPEDIIGRLGGDEFIAFVRDGSKTASRCQALINRSHAWSLDGVQFTLSIGCAVADGTEQFDDLYIKADQALYSVKRQGRDSFLCAG